MSAKIFNRFDYSATLLIYYLSGTPVPDHHPFVSIVLYTEHHAPPATRPQC